MKETKPVCDFDEERLDAARRGPGSGPIARLAAAELALSGDRLADAELELERAGALSGDLAARALLVAAEIALGRDDADRAEALIAEALAARPADPELRVRARLAAARAPFRRATRSDYEQALARIREARDLARELEHAYTLARLLHLEAVARMRLSDYERAGPLFHRAVAELERTEAGRWYGLALSARAVFLADVGLSEQAIADCDRAETIAVALGCVPDALMARNNAARALVLSGETAEARRRLETVLAWECEHERRPEAEIPTLHLLAIACGLEGDFDAARAYGLRLTRQAAGAGAEAPAALYPWHDRRRPVAAMAGRAVVAWADARQGNADGADRLARVARDAGERGEAALAVEARLYLADALAAALPDEAASVLALVDGTDALKASGPLRVLYDRVEARLGAAPLRLRPGQFVIDTRAGWPDYDHTMLMLRRFLVYGVLAETGGNGAEAARRLGLTRSRVHDLKRELRGLPARPCRSPECSDDEAEDGEYYARQLRKVADVAGA